MAGQRYGVALWCRTSANFYVVLIWPKGSFVLRQWGSEVPLQYTTRRGSSIRLVRLKRDIIPALWNSQEHRIGYRTFPLQLRAR